MSIQRLAVSNFKSFDKLEVELRPFNVVVGPNAAGKSNFVEILRFWRDLAEGLENAVSLQGGMSYLANLGDVYSPVVLDVMTGEGSERILASLDPVSYSTDAIRVTPLGYEEKVVFRTGSDLHQARLEERRADFHCRLNISGETGQFIWSGHVVMTHDQPLSLVADPGMEPGAQEQVEGMRQLLGTLFFRSPQDIAIFDFEPKLLKAPHPVRGRARLASDGSNLPLTLRHLLQKPQQKKTFLRLLKDLLPFAEDLSIEELGDQSVLVYLEERFSEARSMPSAFLSEGTLALMALLVALFFDDSPVTVLEEPEKSIHPHLISRLVDLMKEASRHKQLIITTHNPQILRHVEIEDILLVQRDPRGFSRISRPADSREIRSFLENDLGADDLFIQDLLGVGNEV